MRDIMKCDYSSVSTLFEERVCLHHPGGESLEAPILAEG